MAIKGGATETASFITQFERKWVDCKDLVARLEKPREFIHPIGGRSAFAYDATVLADICKVVLEARMAGLLKKSGKRLNDIADHCEILVRFFARVGIIALVDEATKDQTVIWTMTGWSFVFFEALVQLIYTLTNKEFKTQNLS